MAGSLPTPLPNGTAIEKYNFFSGFPWEHVHKEIGLNNPSICFFLVDSFSLAILPIKAEQNIVFFYV